MAVPDESGTVFTVAPPEALRAKQRRMPHSVLVNAYGMTEFGGSVVMVDPATATTRGWPPRGRRSPAWRSFRLRERLEAELALRSR